MIIVLDSDRFRVRFYVIGVIWFRLEDFVNKCVYAYVKF